MNIVQAIETAGPGGAEHVLISLCRGLAKRGHNVCALLLRNGWLGAKLESHGIEVKVLELRKPVDRRFLANHEDYLGAWKHPSTVECLRQFFSVIVAEDPNLSGTVTATRSTAIVAGDDRTAIQTVGNLVDAEGPFVDYVDTNITRLGRSVVITDAGDIPAPAPNQLRFIEPVITRLATGL